MSGQEIQTKGKDKQMTKTRDCNPGILNPRIGEIPIPGLQKFLIIALFRAINAKNNNSGV